MIGMLVLDAHQHAQQLATVQTHEEGEEECTEEQMRLREGDSEAFLKSPARLSTFVVIVLSSPKVLK